MALYNVCRSCGHRLSHTVKQCLHCGSFSSTMASKQVLSGVFVAAAVLLIVIVSKLL